MFNWFRKKEVPKEAPVETRVEIDDWVPRFGPWEKRTFCHCGNENKCLVPVVCSQCGHEDKWETYVCREEWEYSPSRKEVEYISRVGFRMVGTKRNKHIVRWTEDHCEVSRGNE